MRQFRESVCIQRTQTSATTERCWVVKFEASTREFETARSFTPFIPSPRLIANTMAGVAPADAAVPGDGVPFDKYCKCCCYACYCCDCEYERCFGCRSSGQVCCSRGDNMICKYAKAGEPGLIFSQRDVSATCDCFKFNAFSQCCCLHIVFDLCCNPKGVHDILKPAERINLSASFTPESQLKPVCCWTCCSRSALDCSAQCQDSACCCCAAVSSSEYCCLVCRHRFKACCCNKFEDPTTCCFEQKVGLFCDPFQFRCNERQRMYGVDNRCACPCNEEVPCGLSLLPCAVCCVSFKPTFLCWVTVADVQAAAKK
jgi:hypothetical protein